jgi:hypothetical protein|tara:strand:- start:6291 stop:6572 length:282 start_codon:yes stop_codon:yes gene_type:complete
MNKIIDWHKEYCERLRLILNISHYAMYWMAFIKGAILVVLICMLMGCTVGSKKVNPPLMVLEKFWDTLGSGMDKTKSKSKDKEAEEKEWNEIK